MDNNESSVVTLDKGGILVATMLNGTTDSQFTLLRGVPSNDDKRIDEYLWTEVYLKGEPVLLRQRVQNPILIDVPGTYRFRNDGLDDEQAIIDMTVYK